MSISIEMKIKTDVDQMHVEVLESEVYVFVKRNEKYLGVHIPIKDMRRLARFILDEAKESEQ